MKTTKDTTDAELIKQIYEFEFSQHKTFVTEKQRLDYIMQVVLDYACKREQARVQELKRFTKVNSSIHGTSYFSSNDYLVKISEIFGGGK